MYCINCVDDDDTINNATNDDDDDDTIRLFDNNDAIDDNNDAIDVNDDAIIALSNYMHTRTRILLNNLMNRWIICNPGPYHHI